jgi:hypothetical protein
VPLPLKGRHNLATYTQLGAANAPVSRFMRENTLRNVLMVKAIEESDRAGTLIPPADRAAATREALRGADDRPTADAGPLDAKALLALATRADILRRQVVARYPFVETLLSQRGMALAGGLLILVSLFVGLSLSALDGSRRIDILAFPLLGLILWNLVVYVVVAINGIKSLTRKTRRSSSLASLLVMAALSRIKRVIVKSAAFNAVLAEALGRFLGEWAAATKPLWIARTVRLLHLCAAAIGIGLIAGLYLRGIVLDYRAGWESTFLDGAQVQALLSLIYAPASALTGIAIPGEAHITTIRIINGIGGENAARWIHLLAATTVLFVVLPRLVLAFMQSATILRHALHASVPPSLAAYYRTAFGAINGGHGVVAVMPYAYEPFGGATAALRRLLSNAFGESLVITLHAGARYGEEERFLRQLAERGDDSADVVALLFNLAATPEDENHGAIIAGARDWLQRSRNHARLLVLVDERPFAARMATSSDNRLAERRESWRSFIAAHGLTACFVDLGQTDPSASAMESAERLRNAVWQPATT